MAPTHLLPIEDLPLPGELVWCKFPKRHLPDERRVARPVLVRQSTVLHHPDGYDYGSVTVTYGTDARSHGNRQCDFFIEWPEWKKLGLHKATVFILDANNTKTLLWSSISFITQGNIIDQSLFIGDLNDAQWAELKAQAAKPRP